MSKLTASYIAGFIDGEGYLGIENHKGCGSAHYRAVIKVCVTKQEIIEWFKNSFGGHIDKRFENHPRYNTAYIWIFAGRKIEPFLRKIQPYLRIKKRQAEILLKRIEIYKKIGDPNTKGKGRNFAYQPQYIEEMRRLYEEIRLLNKRGK